MKKLITRYRVWRMYRKLYKRYGRERIHEWIRAIAEVSKVCASYAITSVEAAAALYSLGVMMDEDAE